MLSQGLKYLFNPFLCSGSAQNCPFICQRHGLFLWLVNKEPSCRRCYAFWAGMFQLLTSNNLWFLCSFAPQLSLSLLPSLLLKFQTEPRHRCWNNIVGHYNPNYCDELKFSTLQRYLIISKIFRYSKDFVGGKIFALLLLCLFLKERKQTNCLHLLDDCHRVWN